MNSKNIVIAGLTAALLAGAFFVIQNPARNGTDGQSVGALSNPIIQSPYFGFGGDIFYGGHTESLTPATTTVCAIQSPAATSTLIMGSVRFTTSSTTASTVVLARATTAFATTTNLGSASVGANAQATIISERAAAGGDALDETFPPNTWFVVGMAGGAGTFSPTGVCQAYWIQD